MPGFDGTGPMGMGPMTGGARGRCSPYGRSFGPGGSSPGYGWGRGRGRGYRHMYWATGFPGLMKPGTTGPWRSPLSTPYNREQEVDILKDQAVALREELDTINNRLRNLESEGKQAD